MKPLLVVDPAKCGREERVRLVLDGFDLPDEVLIGIRLTMAEQAHFRMLEDNRRPWERP